MKDPFLPLPSAFVRCKMQQGKVNEVQLPVFVYVCMYVCVFISMCAVFTLYLQQLQVLIPG